jgi:tRNA A-37 threonylcarbamoyl transferase component Bud32
MEDVGADSDFASLRQDRAQRFESVGVLVGLLHRAGFTHRDLKPSNIRFLSGGEACLIDLDGVRRVGEVTQRQAVDDLVKFGRRLVELAMLLPRDAARFLSGYCRSRGTKRRTVWWYLVKARAVRHEEFQSMRHSGRGAQTARGMARSSRPSLR